MPKFHLRRRLLPLAALRSPRKVFATTRRWYPSVRYFSRQQPVQEIQSGPQRPQSDTEANAGFSSSSSSSSSSTDTDQKRIPLRRRLANAWNNTPTVWYPLPVGVGALLLAVLQYRKRSKREDGADGDANIDGDDQPARYKGRWQVKVYGALPLRNMSRLWGYMNSLELPVWFRPVGFTFYAWCFGVNLDEAEHSDLTVYPSLGEFFYRRLRPGVRPIADAALVSPADGTILHFGKITNARVEQVKGITYSLDALLGAPVPSDPSQQPYAVPFESRQGGEVDDQHFGDINGIEYTLQQLLGSGSSGAGTESEPASGTSTPIARESSSPMGADPSTPLLSPGGTPHTKREGHVEDASMPDDTTAADSISVAAQLGSASVPPPLKRTTSVSVVKPGNELFFTVIYLAPGDYHRFHSAAAWVVEKRRHFAGELFSVSPWIARRVQDLFVLNERVALLGRWRYGFFSMVPVGATNVGSIKINFDEALRTNERRARRKAPVSPGNFTEATYAGASSILRGQPLQPGQEMGGFRLGSTIVLVFEAPGEEWEFDSKIKAGAKVKVGQKLGDVRKSTSD